MPDGTLAPGQAGAPCPLCRAAGAPLFRKKRPDDLLKDRSARYETGPREARRLRLAHVLRRAGAVDRFATREGAR